MYSMDRRDFVRTGIAASIATSLRVTAQVKPVKKPNILFVFSDQHRECSMAGKAYSSVVAPALVAAIPQLQTGLQNLFHRARQRRRSRPSSLQHFAAAP